MNYSKSQISFLPFIRQPASNNNIIYTTLLCALENAKRYGHTVRIVTFNQRLYAKAREMVSAAQQNTGERFQILFLIIFLTILLIFSLMGIYVASNV